MKKLLVKWQKLFLFVQLLTLLYILFFSPDFANIKMLVWVILSCTGLFIVAFSVRGGSLDKNKSNYILLSIFLCSLISLFLISVSWIIGLITLNM